MRIKYVLVSLLLIVAFLPGIFGQENDNWYYGKPVKDIKFEGLVHIPMADVTAVTNRYIGEIFSDDLYAEILSKIYALDYFTDDIEPTAVAADEKMDSVILRFKVTELPIITRIEYKGNTAVSRMDLDEAVSIKVKEIHNKAKVIMSERAIRDLYLSKGFTNIKVTSTTKEEFNEVTVTFNISEGNSSIITDIIFEGNQVVSSKTLKGEMELSEKKLFKDGAFEEAKLEMDKQKITDYYHNRGYADAVILDVRREIVPNPEKKRDEMTLIFVIREGVQYTYGGMTITGNKVFDTETLLNCIRIKEGSLYNNMRIQEGLMYISDLYYENGYTSNQFYPQQQKDVDNKVVTYSLQIIERERSHIESITVKDNIKTKDYVILREIPLESGDIFSKAKITNGLRNLFNTQYFSAVVPDIQPGSEQNLVNLIISVEEQSTTSLEFGVTFSGVTEPGAWPVSLFAKWQDSNLAGTGKTISASVEASKTKQAIGFGFSERWLFGKPITFSVSANYEHNNTTALQKVYFPSGFNDEDYYFSYENHTMSIGTSLGKRWTPDFAILSLSGGITSSLQRNIYDQQLYIPYDDTISDYCTKWGWGNTIYSSFSVDARDINYDPNKGWFASERIGWTGFVPGLENQFFFRTDTKLEGYVTLLDKPVTKKWNLKFVLATYSGISYILPTPNTTLSERNSVYIDGMFTGRGWTSTEMYHHRGQFLWNSNVELRMPVAAGILAVDLFFDAATVQLTNKNKKFDLGNIETWYFSFGPSVRFCLPQFPLRLLFTNTFQIIDGECKWGVDGNSGGPDWQFVLSFNLINR